MAGRYAASRRRALSTWVATVVGVVTALGTLQLAQLAGPTGPTDLPDRTEATRPAGARVSDDSLRAVAPPSRPATATPAPTGRTVQVHYAAPRRTPSGAIDVTRTLDEIVARGSTVYSYLIYSRAGYRSAQDWSRLPAFLVAARARGIGVQVTLTPPSSTSSDGAPCSADLLSPYRGDYEAWMRELGRLARRHPNLLAVVMDDYAYSAPGGMGATCSTFPRGTLTRWRRTLRTYAHRPIPVLPVLYLHDLTGPGAIYAAIAREAPVVVWPYTSIGSGRMTAQYAAIRAVHPELAIYVLVYAAPYKGDAPTVATVHREVAAARALGAAGVVIYQEPLF